MEYFLLQVFFYLFMQELIWMWLLLVLVLSIKVVKLITLESVTVLYLKDTLFHVIIILWENIFFFVRLRERSTSMGGTDTNSF